MWNVIADFFTAVPFWELLLIFVAKVIEVSLGTLRHILVAKGFKKQAAFLSFFELMLWVFVASQVITNIMAAPIKGIVYSLGYAVGVLVGARVEAILAFGKIMVQIIVDKSVEQSMSNALRDNGYGVTSISGSGKSGEKAILMIFSNRKGKDKLLKKIGVLNPDAMIITHDVSTLKGGHVAKNKILK